MTAPPSTTRCTRKTGSREELIRRAHVLLDARGATLSATKVSRLVSGYLRTSGADSFEQALIDSIDEHRRIAYADPTGECAAANADRGRRR